MLNHKSFLCFHRKVTLINPCYTTARKFAADIGKIIALSPALGNICRILTRHLHHLVNDRSSWDSRVKLDLVSIKELEFWHSSLKSQGQLGEN